MRSTTFSCPQFPFSTHTTKLILFPEFLKFYNKKRYHFNDLLFSNKLPWFDRLTMEFFVTMMIREPHHDSRRADDSVFILRIYSHNRGCKTLYIVCRKSYIPPTSPPQALNPGLSSFPPHFSCCRKGSPSVFFSAPQYVFPKRAFASTG